MKMMDSRLDESQCIINLNRFEMHGMPSTLSLIKSEASLGEPEDHIILP